MELEAVFTHTSEANERNAARIMSFTTSNKPKFTCSILRDTGGYLLIVQSEIQALVSSVTFGSTGCCNKHEQLFV